MAQDQVEADIHSYLRALYRRRWLAGAAFAIPVVIAFVYAFTATPTYRATARLVLETENPNVVTFQEVISRRNQVTPNTQTTQRDMLRSRSLARATLDRLGLWDHPEFGGGLDERLNPLRAVRRGLSSVRSAIFPSRSPRDSPADAAIQAESIAISALQDRLQVSAGQNSRVLRLRFTSFDGQLAADVINTLAQLHVERDMEGDIRGCVLRARVRDHSISFAGASPFLVSASHVVGFHAPGVDFVDILGFDECCDRPSDTWLVGPWFFGEERPVHQAEGVDLEDGPNYLPPVHGAVLF